MAGEKKNEILDNIVLLWVLRLVNCRRRKDCTSKPINQATESCVYAAPFGRGI